MFNTNSLRVRKRLMNPGADGGAIMFRQFVPPLKPYEESPRVREDREERKEYKIAKKRKPKNKVTKAQMKKKMAKLRAMRKKK